MFSRARRPWTYVIALGIVSASFLALAARAAVPVGRLTWFGQSCFLLESATGTRVVMDPIPAGIGYPLPESLHADVITISHEHGDHNNVGLVTNKPKVLRGLTFDKKGWVSISEKVKDVSIRSVGVYHDDQKGGARGLNTIFVFEVGGVRVAHLGDLGHLLTDQQLSALGSVDVVLIPVGGFFTIDARQATRVIDQIRPRLIVIPMHHKTKGLTIKELYPVDAFLEGRSNVRRETGNSIALTGLRSRPSVQTVVLNDE